MNDVSKYIDEFKNIVNMDDAQLNRGQMPYYPLLVMYVGDNAATAAHETISEQLFDMWPAYRNDLEFLKIENKNDVIQYTRMNNGTETMNAQGIISIVLPALLDINGVFPNLAFFRLYFVMSSNGYTNLEDYKKDIEYIKKTAKLVKNQGISANILVFFLVDESLQDAENNSLARIIRNDLRENPVEGCRICIVSNRTQSGHIVSDYSLPCKAIASMIAVSDSTVQQAADFFSPGYSTIGFYRDAKPMDSITQITVCRVLDKINQVITSTQAENIPGIENKRLVVLNEYADECIPKTLSMDMISSLPLTSMMELSDTDSFENVNKQTMGVLQYLLDEKLDEMISTLQKESALFSEDPTVCRKFTDQMIKKIENEMNFYDAARTLQNQGVINNALLSSVTSSISGQSFREEFCERLKSGLSASEEVHEYFKKLVAHICTRATEVNRQWINLLNSKQRLHPIRDDSLLQYYNALCDNVLDSCDMQGKFGKVQSIEEIETGISDIFWKLIHDNPIYRYDLLAEKAERLGDERGWGREHIDKMIRNILSMPMDNFFPNNGVPLDAPIRRVIILNDELDFKQDGVSSYRTGSKNFIDRIDWYDLTEQHLIT